MDAMAQDPSAFERFGNWCLISNGYWGGWAWDLSWIATTHLGALQLKKPDVSKWAEPVFRAFVAGAWRLIWTPKSLYWEAKPVVHTEAGDGVVKRLHCDDGPAAPNEIANLYFIHGVMVPADVVLCPEKLSIKDIEAESNQEVRRIMIERCAGRDARPDDGWLKYIQESGAEVVDHRFSERDQQRECLFVMRDGRKLVVVTDPSTARRYTLGVPREVATCEQAQGFLSHGLDKLCIGRT